MAFFELGFLNQLGFLNSGAIIFEFMNLLVK